MITTEAEWNTSTNIDELLQYIFDHYSDNRKLRLFALACANSVSQYANNSYWQLLEQAEAYTDNLIAYSAMTGLQRFLFSTIKFANTPQELIQRYAELIICYNSLTPINTSLGNLTTLMKALMELLNNEQIEPTRKEDTIHLPQLMMPPLLHEIFGNPFKDYTKSIKNIATTAKNMAITIYNTKDFQLLPILADALEDSNYNDQDVLNHFRSNCNHTKGCWALDLIYRGTYVVRTN